MKKTLFFAIMTLIMLIAISCKNKSGKNVAEPGITKSTDKEQFLLIGKDIVTEVIVKPDTLGDPWELEKVKGFNGRKMFSDLFEKIYNSKLTVYDCFSGKALDKVSVKKIEKEVGNDISKIGKIQFLEDWYFDPLTNNISKKVKTVTFGYEIIREGGLPTGYKGLFSLKIE